ncbi:MAG: NUDIX hydrolase [Bacteroidales bacterium]|nr:NUDIX hydrolase [Bacteroidales bacterium]
MAEFEHINEDKLFCYQYPHPAVTIDCVIFGFDGNAINVLLIERNEPPYLGSWALPGGFINMNETAEEAACRRLREETHLEHISLKQFHTFSEVLRDPRERVITIAYLALINKDEQAVVGGNGNSRAEWFKWNELPPVAFDHLKIIQEGRKFLKDWLKLEPIAFKMLGEQFKMSELQKLYELINETTYDRRNFQRKMLSSGYLYDQSEDASDTPEMSKTIKQPTASYSIIAGATDDKERSQRISRILTFLQEKFDEDQKENPNGKNPFDL